ncbi:hypothetical protein [Bradyrhizobium tropiciagri]|uniref:hypothetical protein n=1 Tax=Bradyrhizobium tropiciagri TaxID=312253 RepID=UPI001009B823|nr:hypothetical protein [Bradyrhizobium tropiciagri]
MAKISKTTPCKAAGGGQRSTRLLDTSGNSPVFFQYSEIARVRSSEGAWGICMLPSCWRAAVHPYAIRNEIGLLAITTAVIVIVAAEHPETAWLEESASRILKPASAD